MPRHNVIRLAIAATALSPLLFVRFDEPTAGLQIYKHLAKAGSLVGTVLLVWQVILGFRGLSARLTDDVIWALDLHRLLGAVALPLVLLHPVFITLYYLDKHGHNLWRLQAGPAFDSFVVVGICSMTLLGLIVVSSVLLRKAMGRTGWYWTHLSSYVLLPAVFVHALPIGQTLRHTGLFWVWLALAAVVALAFAQRLLLRLGVFTRAYRVGEVIEQGQATSEIVLHPLGAPLHPRIGQFVYVRRGRFGFARPYTVSAFDPAAGSLSITVKAQGPGSSALRQVEPGQLIALDGPYGIFGQEALASGKPLVMVAGGIGITAFRRLLRHLEATPNRPAWLFYGSLKPADVSYSDELKALEHVEVVCVMSDAPDWPGEKGFITLELIARHVDKALPRCEFLLCGPPVMVEKLEEQLDAHDVPARQVHHELFQ